MSLLYINMLVSALAVSCLIIIHASINLQFIIKLNRSASVLEASMNEVNFIKRILEKYNSSSKVLDFKLVQKADECPPGYNETKFYHWEGTVEGIHLQAARFKNSCAFEISFQKNSTPPYFDGYEIVQSTCRDLYNTTRTQCKYLFITANLNDCSSGSNYCSCPDSYTFNKYQTEEDKQKYLSNRNYTIIKPVKDTYFSSLYGQKLCSKQLNAKSFLSKENCSNTTFSGDSFSYCWDYMCVNSNSCPNTLFRNGSELKKPVYGINFNYGGRKCSKSLENSEMFQYKLIEETFYLSSSSVPYSKICDKVVMYNESFLDQTILAKYNSSRDYYQEQGIYDVILNNIDSFSDTRHRFTPFLTDPIFITVEADLNWNFENNYCSSGIRTVLSSVYLKSQEILEVNSNKDTLNTINTVVLSVTIIIAVWMLINFFHFLRSAPKKMFENKVVKLFFMITIIQFVVNLVKYFVLHKNLQINTVKTAFFDLLNKNCTQNEPSVTDALTKINKGIDYFTLNYNKNLGVVLIENGIAIVFFFFTFLPFMTLKEMIWF